MQKEPARVRPENSYVKGIRINERADNTTTHTKAAKEISFAA
jgi:hypothetical protein